MRIHDNVDADKIKDIINKKFTGVIKQLPPVKSRVKREEREREVKSFEILEQDDKNFLFKTEVQGGTYIRKLIHDLGETLGTGAHMLELRRIRAGIFEEEGSHTLYELEKAVEEYKNGDDAALKNMIYPGEIISKIYPVVDVKSEIVGRLLHGSPLFSKDVNPKKKFNISDKISVFSGDKFIGVFRVVLQGEIFAKPEFVLQPINN